MPSTGRAPQPLELADAILVVQGRGGGQRCSWHSFQRLPRLCPASSRLGQRLQPPPAARPTWAAATEASGSSRRAAAAAPARPSPTRMKTLASHTGRRPLSGAAPPRPPRKPRSATPSLQAHQQQRRRHRPLKQNPEEPSGHLRRRQLAHCPAQLTPRGRRPCRPLPSQRPDRGRRRKRRVRQDHHLL